MLRQADGNVGLTLGIVLILAGTESIFFLVTGTELFWIQYKKGVSNTLMVLVVTVKHLLVSSSLPASQRTRIQDTLRTADLNDPNNVPYHGSSHSV